MFLVFVLPGTRMVLYTDVPGTRGYGTGIVRSVYQVRSVLVQGMLKQILCKRNSFVSVQCTQYGKSKSNNIHHEVL